MRACVLWQHAHGDGAQPCPYLELPGVPCARRGLSASLMAWLASGTEMQNPADFPSTSATNARRGSMGASVPSR